MASRNANAATKASSGARSNGDGFDRSKLA
jgi:hypothetical protein